MKAITCGAGLAGLTPAWWLEWDGWDVVLAERVERPAGRRIPRDASGMNDDSQPETSMLITELHTDSGVRLLPFGEIDMATVGQVRDAIIAVLARDKPPAIVLDLQNVSFIDSTGVGELVRCHRAATVCGSALTVENLAPFPRRQLWATGLLGLFGVADQHHDDEVPTEQIGRNA